MTPRYRVPPPIIMVLDSSMVSDGAKDSIRFGMGEAVQAYAQACVDNAIEYERGLADQDAGVTHVRMAGVPVSLTDLLGSLLGDDDKDDPLMNAIIRSGVDVPEDGSEPSFYGVLVTHYGDVEVEGMPPRIRELYLKTLNDWRARQEEAVTDEMLGTNDGRCTCIHIDGAIGISMNCPVHGRIGPS